jgi:hypothetical protein
VTKRSAFKTFSILSANEYPVLGMFSVGRSPPASYSSSSAPGGDSAPALRSVRSVDDDGRRRTMPRRSSAIDVDDEYDEYDDGCRGRDGGATVATNACATPSRIRVERANISAINDCGRRADDDVVGCDDFSPVFFDVVIVADDAPPRGASVRRLTFPFVGIIALSKRPPLELPSFFFRWCLCVCDGVMWGGRWAVD